MSNYNDDATAGSWSMNGTEWNAMATVIDASKTKTDFITITQAVDLDTLESDVTTNTTNIATKADKNATIQTKSANYTLVAGDNNNIIEVDTTSTITLPDGLDTGFQAVIVNIGSAQTITLSADTTLTSKDSATTITSQYGAVTVVHVGSNVWRAYGDLA